MAYLYLTRSYRNVKTKYSRLVQPHFETIKNLDDPKPLFDRFGALPIFKKQVDNLRIILQEVNLEISNENYSAYCVRLVLPRGSKDYNIFHWVPNVKKWLDNNPIDNDEVSEIRNWLYSELEKEKKSKKLPELPEGLKKWLSIGGLPLLNSTIYETQEWTESIREKEIYDFKETICNIIPDIQSNSQSVSKIWECDNDRNISLIQGNNQIYILSEIIGNILVLYKIFKGQQPNEDAIENVLKNYRYDGKLNKELLIKDAKRAYPDYILAAPELWFKIQEDSVANLALSPEEEDLLQSATFPLFVNGQAGSGKSTMLFYLFAHFCSLQKDGKPLFLTYNKRLLETAKKNVISILQNHPNYSESEIDNNKIDSYFNPFQNFILNNLLSDEERQNFSKAKYISFSKFKQCFQGNYSEIKLNCKLRKKGYSPELIWHIIRTYIKGSSFDDYFSFKKYKCLPKKDKSVNEEMYKDVFDTIWNNWYKKFLDDYEHWDDQDLIRYILTNRKDNYPQFPVIFCDEAQDFTRIEIELLLRLSSFTKYNLSHHSNIPFSFAGDPYQTINPTGFRWESLKTIFNEKFEKLNPQGLNIRFEPLTQNYRSKPSIIKFTNLIQGIRYIYLNLQELRPQLAWQKMEGVSPCIFVLDKEINGDDLKGVADKTIILISTEAGENSEFNYAKNDKILKQFIQLPDDENIPISNVMSASTSKGLEFDKVILYKFGENAPNAFSKARAGDELNDSEFIEISHFFNKLYVAVSRAKNFLFILDTDTGFQNFWKYFMNTDLLKAELDKGNFWNAKDVEPLVKGTKADIINIKEENPEKVAREFEDNGMIQEKYDSLQRAVEFYKSSGLTSDALRCEAWAFWFKENWLESGKIFKKLNENVQASKSFWRGQHWQELELLYQADEGKKLHKYLSLYMLDREQFGILLTIDDFVDQVEITDETWKKVVDKIQKDLLTKTDEQEKFSEYATFCKKLAGKGFKQLYNVAGNFFFKDNSFENAIDCWDRTNNSEHKDYYTSKLSLARDVNEKIFWYLKLKQDDSIIKIYKETLTHEKLLNLESHNIVFAVLLRNNAFDDALKYQGIALQIKVKRLIEVAESFNSTEQEIDSKRKIFDMLLENDAEGIDILKNNLKIFRDFFNNKEAIRLILKQQNWKELLDELDNELRKALPGKFIESFVDVVCEELEHKTVSRLFYAINLVGELNKRDDKLTENIKLIKAIAYSEVIPNMFPFGERENLERFVTKCVWEKTGWQSDMNFKEIGTALERLGAKSTTLQNEIYEYIIQYEPNFVHWAKLRWIRVAQRRAKYEKEQGRKPLVAKINKDIEEKITQWQLDKDQIEAEPDYPVLRERIPSFRFKNVTLSGFTKDPATDERRKRITLSLNNYEIFIYWLTKKVSIENLSSNETVTIDIINKGIGGLGVTKQEESFDVGKTYKGIFTSHNTLILEIEGLNLKIAFKNNQRNT